MGESFGEIDCQNMIPRHEIKELVAINAQKVRRLRVSLLS
jgi:hypothetical protein